MIYFISTIPKYVSLPIVTIFISPIFKNTEFNVKRKSGKMKLQKRLVKKGRKEQHLPESCQQTVTGRRESRKTRSFKSTLWLLLAVIPFSFCHFKRPEPTNSNHLALVLALIPNSPLFTLTFCQDCNPCNSSTFKTDLMHSRHVYIALLYHSFVADKGFVEANVLTS